jgi:uncharacterized protein (DUF433 family)
MKEELTTKMHSEFAVDEETELKLSVWTLLSECDRRKITPESLIDVYGLTMQDIEKYKQSYLENK